MSRPRERRVLQTLFATGVGLIITTFTYSMLRSWPTFDPVATAALIGIGLLQVVIYERLGSMLVAMERLVELAEQGRPEEADRPAPPVQAPSETAGFPGA